MKKLFLSAGVCLLMAACSSDSYDVANNLESATVTKSYSDLVRELEAEFPDKKVYSESNFPDFSAQIEALQANATEEIPQETNGVSLRAVLPSTIFGPYGSDYYGNRFEAPITLYPGETTKAITAIRIAYTATYVNGIQLYWVNDKKEVSYSPFYGTVGTTDRYVYLADGEHVYQARVLYDAGYIRTIILITNYNVYTFGTATASYYSADVNFMNLNKRLGGIFGRTNGKYLHQIGFYTYTNPTTGGGTEER